ncbi:MAG TPA: ferritin [Bacteroidales bacterium]|jgi:ferritin|nr:ferritin [Bacteroidales bacterium]HQH24867.1 ferritin [Bacteroidales bacterium]HQJ81874.1 ferritin [Bacteroidales bacterium]
MLKKNVEDLCNRQVEREGYSSILYLSMASWAEANGMAGIAEWLYAQAEEEKDHMLRFVRYINERGGKAVIPAFSKPPEDFAGIVELFDDVLKHEQYITASINEIVELTLAEKDYSTHNFLQWFVAEQVEEESSAQAIVDKLKLGGRNILYQLDRDIMKLRESED